MSVFLDLTKVADFWWKNADNSGTQGVSRDSYISRPSLGKL